MVDVPDGSNLTPPPLPGSDPQPTTLPALPGSDRQPEKLPKRPGFELIFTWILQSFLHGADPKDDAYGEAVLRQSERLADRILDDYPGLIGSIPKITNPVGLMSWHRPN